MKILIFYTYNKGLLSNFFQELSARLVADGNSVVNFYLKHKEDYFTQNGIEIYGFQRRGFFWNYKQIYKIINKTKPDIIISNFSYVNPALLFGKILRVKKNIVWFHTVFDFAKPSWYKVINKSLFLSLADVVIANSKTLQDEMTDVYRVPKSKTARVPFWTNINRFKSENFDLEGERNCFKIGCPGRLEKDKNFQMVIQSLSKLSKLSEKKIHLYLAGDGTYEDNLRTLVNDLSLSNRVSFLGSLSVNQMVTFYKNMDVIVLPSLHEAFGLVFIEAIALGTPVLVSSQFGSLSFVDAEKYNLKDITFDPTAPNDLLSKLELFIRGEGRAKDYYQKLYEETFNKEVIYKQIKCILLEESKK